MTIREKLHDYLLRKRSQKQAALRDAIRDHDQFAEAANLIKPVLEEHPGWTWGHALKHLYETGADLPLANPYLSRKRCR